MHEERSSTGGKMRFHARKARLGLGPETHDRSGPTGSLPADLGRRSALKKALGLAAAGAVGGSALAETFASPASAATTTETGAIAPAVVNLTDAPTIAVDASLGNDFRVTIAASRAMGNPVNAVDGQKILMQITQGPAGSSTVTWGSSYEFCAALPQPASSTTAGQTDLLAFVYNGTKSKWLLVAVVNGFNPATVTQPSGTFRLFPTTIGPSTPASYTGPFLAGVQFEVTSGGTWLGGYWWWVCPEGQTSGPQKFALWQVYTTRVGTLVASATVTSGTLIPGQWNYVPLAAPIPLSPGATYVAATGFSDGFPTTNNQFGAGQPYAAGIVTGPLSAYSDSAGSLPAPFGMGQGLFGTAGTDPTISMPNDSWESANFWMDLQITTTPPAGTTYRLWPNLPTVPGALLADSLAYTLATEYTLSATCQLDRIWFYSPSGAAALPSRCAIWSASSQTEVTGTDNPAPAWSGPAGSGWVSCSYSGVTLPPGDYKVAVYYGGGSNWLQATTSYWAGGGPGTDGITAGPLSAPGAASASGAGQSTYNQGAWAYPTTYASGTGENYWVDVEVTPT